MCKNCFKHFVLFFKKCQKVAKKASFNLSNINAWKLQS